MHTSRQLFHLHGLGGCACKPPDITSHLLQTARLAACVRFFVIATSGSGDRALNKNLGSNRMLSSRPFYFVCLRDLVTDDLLIAQSDVIRIQDLVSPTFLLRAQFRRDYLVILIKCSARNFRKFIKNIVLYLYNKTHVVIPIFLSNNRSKQQSCYIICLNTISK